MAFVCRSERTLTINESSSVGPGAYLAHKEYQPQPSYAPFSSTSQRETFKPSASYTVPGPGTYTQEQSIPDLDHWGQPKLSLAFASQLSRFPQKQEDPLPGPCSYNLKDPWQSVKFTKKNETSANILRIPLARSIPSIPANHQSHGYEHDQNGELVMQKGNENLHKGTKEDSVGPGHYSIHPPSKTLGTNWHKSKSERNLNRVSTATGPTIGPGCYNKNKVKVEPMYKFKQSAVFASKSPRKPKTSSITPGPGSYAAEISSFSHKKLPFPLQNFGSSSSRFLYKMNETQVGPGYYNINVQNKLQTDPKAPFSSSNSRFEYRNNVNPGPGAYENEDLALQTKKKNLNLQGAFGSTEKRFDYKIDKNAPGPGHYRSDVKKKKNKQMNAVFMSKTKRGTIISDKKGPPPGAYEVNIGFNMQRPPPAGVHLTAKNFSEVNVGFASTTERFVDEKKAKMIPGPGAYDWKLKNSNSKVIISNEDRFKSAPKKGPGPGEYFEECEDKWNKKSFNVLFSEPE